MSRSFLIVWDTTTGYNFNLRDIPFVAAVSKLVVSCSRADGYLTLFDATDLVFSLKVTRLSFELDLTSIFGKGLAFQAEAGDWQLAWTADLTGSTPADQAQPVMQNREMLVNVIYDDNESGDYPPNVSVVLPSLASGAARYVYQQSSGGSPASWVALESAACFASKVTVGNVTADGFVQVWNGQPTGAGQLVACANADLGNFTFDFSVVSGHGLWKRFFFDNGIYIAQSQDGDIFTTVPDAIVFGNSVVAFSDD